MNLPISTTYRKFGICLLILLMALFVNISPAVASYDDAWKFIEEVGNTTLSIVSSDELSTEEKEQKLVELFDDSVDTEWIAKFVMGVHWREATEEQRGEYIKLYHKFLLQSYVPKFKTYTDEKIILIESTKEYENEYLVETEIKATGEPVFRVNYKVRKNYDGSYSIFDIIAEGISMITTQRSEFGSIISRKGIDFLIDRLEAKTSPKK